MTFDELLDEVYNITNRPDLSTQTKSAVKAATLKAHRTDFYSKDIFETGIEFDTADFRQSLDYIELISNWRSLKYLRKAENVDDESGDFFEIITPDEILDSYNINRSDIAYVAGRVLEIRSSTEFSTALLGAYVLPLVAEANYSSWVAEQFPFAIIHEAARAVYKSIGQAEESNGQRDLVVDEYIILRREALSDVGY